MFLDQRSCYAAEGQRVVHTVDEVLDILNIEYWMMLPAKNRSAADE
jgi:hypothetical protein